MSRDERPDESATAQPEYALGLIGRSAAAHRRLLHVQDPYAAHVRRVCRGRVLHLGCGIGRDLAHLGERGVGVDHNPDSVLAARARGCTAYTSAEFAGSPDGVLDGYDSLLVAHVLEYLTRADGEALLKTYLGYLRPGGRVVLICAQERGFGRDPTHVGFLGFAELGTLCRRVRLLVRREYSVPLPRPSGRLFTHHQFVVLADKARALLT